MDISWILALTLYPFFVLWHLNLPPMERGLILGAFTSGLPIAAISILRALYGYRRDVSRGTAITQLEVRLFSLLVNKYDYL